MQGEGYNCITNKTAGDGEWSNVAAQRRWIERRLVAGGGRGDYFINTISPKYQNSISGEISLRPASTNLLGGELVKGNVYSHFRNCAPPLDEKGGIITEKVFPVFCERVFWACFGLVI